MRETPELRKEHKVKTRRLLRRLLEEDLPVMRSESHIVPLFIGNPSKTKDVSDTLLEDFNIYV